MNLKTVLVCGLPGSGKSYFARHLSKVLPAAYLSTDMIRDEILEEKTYSTKEKTKVYNAMKKRMTEAHKQHHNVVTDGTFYKASLRQKFINLARDYSEVFLIEVTAEENLVRERINRKRRNSEADYGIYQKIKKEWEEITVPHMTLKSTNDNLEAMLESAIQYIR